MIGAWITAGAAILVALVTFVLTYWSNRRQSALKARLTRVNRQLSEFYGPLLALTGINDEAWSTFFDKYGVSPDAFFGVNVSPAAFFGVDTDSVPHEKIEVWVEWMRTVFMPSNRKIVDLIETKADLLEDDSMPAVLMKFCAHVAGYEVTLKRWAAGDFSLLTSLIDHPGPPMSEYATEKFAYLKGLQRELLNATTSAQSRSEARGTGNR
jgi:hypothetical protein